MTPDELAALAGHALSTRVADIQRLDGGEFNLSVRLTTSAGTLVARHPLHRLDWVPTLHGQATAMGLARDAGLPIAPVLHVDDDILVYRYVEGRALTEDDAVAGLAFRSGELFSVMHSIPGEGTGPVNADGTSPGWPAHTYFDGLPEETDRLMTTLDSDSGLIAGDLHAASELLATPPPLRSRLVHGDAGIGNLIVANDDIAAIIDFDNAWYGDPAIDLAWWWWRSPGTAPSFQAGCAAGGDTTDDWPLWACRVRLLVGLADIFAARMPERARRIGGLLTIAVNELKNTIT